MEVFINILLILFINKVQNLEIENDGCNRSEEPDEGSKAIFNDPNATFSTGSDNFYEYFDSGLDLEVFGSYACGLSSKNSDLDIRVNDFHTYRYLNLEKIGRNLLYSLEDRNSNGWSA
jgi:hypothetical protein